MVSNVSIGLMIAAIIFSFFIFAGYIMFFRKKVGVSVKPIVLGAVGFIVIVQVLEKILHLIVVTNFPNYADHPWLFGTYGALAAGTFEELGRFALYVWLLKAYRDYKDGVSFGIGWGGIEAVSLMLLINVPNIMFSLMINSGTLEASLGSAMTAEQLNSLKDTLINNGAGYYLLGMLERFMAVILQISFSILVLLGVVRKRFSLVLLSLFLHAAIDFPLVFFQSGYVTQLWMIEAYLAVVAVCGVIFISKSRRRFPAHA